VGHAHRLARISQRIFDDHFVSALAKDYTDRRLVVAVSQLIIDSREVEIHLPGKFGLEIFDLQFDYDEAAHAEMLEKQVEVVILVADLNMILTADECKAFA
jgi:hypothetical protein